MQMTEGESIGRKLKRLWSPDYSYGIDARESIRNDINYLKANYGLKIEMGRQTDKDKPDLRIQKLSLREAHMATAILREEISKYPKEYVETCGISVLRLVGGLSNARKTFGGLAYSDGAVYIAVEAWDTNSFRNTIHHEFFHASDYEFVENGSSHPVWGDLVDSLRELRYDYNWGSINTEEYMDKNYVNAANDNGFASIYGRKNEWEDRATTAGILMSSPMRAKEKALADPIFRKKLNKVAAEMKKRSGGKMDRSYFSKLFKPNK